MITLGQVNKQVIQNISIWQLSEMKMEYLKKNGNLIIKSDNLKLEIGKIKKALYGHFFFKETAEKSDDTQTWH